MTAGFGGAAAEVLTADADVDETEAELAAGAEVCGADDWLL